MLDGLDHVWKAALILVRDGKLEVRLKVAQSEFVVSLMQPDEWPSDLLPKAQELTEKLQHIDNMDANMLLHTAEELLSLAVDVQIAFREENEE